MARTGPLDERNAALDAACRLLLSGGPADVAEVAAELGLDEASTGAALVTMEHRGRLRRNSAGQIVAAAGISVVPSDYEVYIAQRRIWAWCAKTALGMVCALGAGGLVVAESPLTRSKVRVEFDGSHPVSVDCAVFWPSDVFRGTCGSAVDDYCPTFGLFESASAAMAWASTSPVPGEVLTVAEASQRARPQYAASFDIPRQRDRLLAAVTREAGSDPAPPPARPALC